MLDIVVFVVMSVAAVRASSRLLRSRALFAEFGASLAPACLSLLFICGLGGVVYILVVVGLGAMLATAAPVD